MKIKEKLEKEASLKNKLQQEIKGYKKEPRLDLKCDVRLSTFAEAKLQAIQAYEKELLEMIKPLKYKLMLHMKLAEDYNKAVEIIDEFFIIKETK